MGSKLSRTVREHKAAAASPRVSASQQSNTEEIDRQEAHDHEQTQNDAAATPTSTLASPECEPTPTDETDAMDGDLPPRRASDSRSAAILRDLEQLPGDALDYEPPRQPQGARRQQSQAPPTTLKNCLICCTPCDGPGKHPPKEVHPCSSCDNAYCVPCLKTVFLDACKDVSRMPPRCCNQIPLHHVRPYLTADEITLFKAKYEEWGTPNPFYCPVARCSTFIPNRMLPQAKARENGEGKQRVDSGIGTPTKPIVTCPKCEVGICTNCRSLAHANGICNPFDFGVDEQTADLLQKWGYRKCPKCGQGVKRMYGCNHMECRCGAHFCWGCMQGRDNCIGDCDDEDPDDYSEYEPDEEEDDEVQEENAAQSTTPPAPNLAYVFPHMPPIGEVTESPATLANEVLSSSTIERLEETVAETPPSSTRVRNLDGGSSRYWEDQGYDFGEEPDDNYADRSWDCYHDFFTAKIGFKDAFANNASANPMECMKCWATVHPEVEMPDSIRTGKSKTTTAVASASRRTQGSSLRRTDRVQHARRQAMASLRGNRSMESFEPTVASTPLRTSPASFSAFLPPRSSLTPPSLQEGAVAHVVDFYGNTVAIAKQPEGGNTDEEMPDWDEVDEIKSELTFTTKSTPFSFAYECDRCGLLVCHRCKDSLKSHVDEHKEEAQNEEDAAQEVRDSDEDGDEQADEIVGYIFDVDAREADARGDEYETLWTQWVAAH